MTIPFQRPARRSQPDPQPGDSRERNETLPLLTTVVGSYPVGGRPPRRAVQHAVEEQIGAGIDLISDGQVRGDMIATFARHIPGFQLGPDGVWQITDALDVPDAPVTIPDFVFAREIAGARAEVKGIVTGPITLALACRVAPDAPYWGPADPSLLLRLSEILAREVVALVASGARVVQVDEPVLSAALGNQVSAELALDALRDLAAMPRVSVLHVCGDARAVLDDLLLLPFGVLSVEGAAVETLAALDPDQLELTATTIMLGCARTDVEDVEPVGVIRERVQAATRALDPARLWIAPDCGMRGLGEAVARAKLVNIVEAVQDVRAEL